ncbi:MAG: hypothetical protein V7K47_08400 [Nostoc sp.]
MRNGEDEGDVVDLAVVEFRLCKNRAKSRFNYCVVETHQTGDGQWGENFHPTTLLLPHSLFAPYPIPHAQ